jgi:site-specific recombinase XerD
MIITVINYAMTSKVSKALVPSVPQLSLEPIKALVLDSVTSPHSRRAYDRALTDFMDWFLPQGVPFNKAVVQAYARHLEASGLSASTINVRLTAVRRLAAEAGDNGLLDAVLATGITRVKGSKQAGVRTGNWLTAEQAERLINTPDQSRLKGKRDRAVLALMVGCGLRRSEVSALTVESIQQRDGRWAVVDLKGKGNRVRTVPMPSWCAVAIQQWKVAADIQTGYVFRPMNNKGQVLEGVLLPQNIMVLVTRYGRAMGVERLAPHDLRRTFAKLAHKGKSALEQIQLSLGHSSIQTTERYLGVRQDLQDAPCDHLGLKLCSTV